MCEQTMRNPDPKFSPLRVPQPSGWDDALAIIFLTLCVALVLVAILAAI